MPTITFKLLNSLWVRAVIVSLGLLPIPLLVQAEERNVKIPTITVNATGESRAAPDMALINIAVITKGKTAKKALDANNKFMNDVIKSLKSNGIAEKDLQTSDLSIYQSNNDDNGEKDDTENIYNVSNFLTAHIRDLSNIGKIFDQTMAFGVNSVNGVIFTNSDTKPFYKEARKRAVAEAIEKATTIAEAANVKLGEIIGIIEKDSGYQVAPRLMNASSQSSETNFLSGELSYSVNITAVFAIK